MPFLLAAAVTYYNSANVKVALIEHVNKSIEHHSTNHTIPMIAISMHNTITVIASRIYKLIDSPLTS